MVTLCEIEIKFLLFSCLGNVNQLFERAMIRTELVRKSPSGRYLRKIRENPIVSRCPYNNLKTLRALPERS